MKSRAMENATAADGKKMAVALNGTERKAMSELKPCQMEPKQAAEKLQESYDYMTHVMPEGKRSQATINLLAAMSCAISTLCAQSSNEPLALDELRKMRGQVVDIPESEFWYSGRGTVLDDGVYDPKDQDGYWPFEYYGEWLAYHRKPERSENDGL